MAKKARKGKAGKPSVCDRLREEAEKVAREEGFEIVDARCSIMASMFVPDGKPKKKMAFSFTIVGTDRK